MNTNIYARLSEIQSLVTYNGNSIKIPNEDKTNIFMGIGIWSEKYKLSIGLPVDVMQMLVTATILRSQILETHPGKPSNVIILIADSMAQEAGAEENEVLKIVAIYKKCMEPLLALLNLKDSTHIILSSELENDFEYNKTLNLFDENEVLLSHKKDKKHYRYIRSQTAITHYMHTHRDVGVKVGWICADTSKQLDNSPIEHESLINWDEFKYDRVCSASSTGSTLQYLYAKAGMIQRIKKINASRRRLEVSVSEGCPYTAYKGHNRYVIQHENKMDIKEICRIQPRVATQWIQIAQACAELAQLRIVSDNILPENCIKKNNQTATVYNMLNYWSNLLEPLNAIE